LPELSEKQKQGIVAWKQGLFYIAKWPDENGKYTKENTKYSRKAIEGVKYHKGIGSAAESVIKKHGEIPEELKFGMGIQNITILRGKQKPIMKFELAKVHRHRTGQKLQKELTPSLGGMR
jgi:hypothetical protein